MIILYTAALAFYFIMLEYGKMKVQNLINRKE